MRQALIQEAEARCLPYSLEQPTDERYRFTPVRGVRRRRGLHDFALMPADERQRRPLVRVEVKEGQPSARRDAAGRPMDVPALSKDLRKLLLEKAIDGRAVLHVLQAANRGTLSSLLRKYRVALHAAQTHLAREHPDAEAGTRATWFSVLFLIVRRRGRLGGNRPALWRAVINTARPPGECCLAAEEVTPF